jgi:hypothetical protein
MRVRTVWKSRSCVAIAVGPDVLKAHMARVVEALSVRALGINLRITNEGLAGMSLGWMLR